MKSINNNEWEWTTGTEFLDLWDTPFAGTIYIDRVVYLRRDPVHQEDDDDATD